MTVTAVAAGSQFQCSAVAGFSNGTSQDVTGEAMWASSDPHVATVSATGLVSPLASGTSTITATYQGVAGRITLAVSTVAGSPPSSAQPTYTLRGVVRATPLDETVAGAQIEATHDGLVVGTATSAANGSYSIAGLIAQEYVLRVRKIGYFVRGIDVLVAGDTTRDLVMDRNRRSLEGAAYEAPPCSSSPIQSALVQVVDGPDAGKSGLTDREGYRYSIPDVAWGVIRLRATKDGYGPSEVTVSVPLSDVISGPLRQDFTLARMSAQGLSGEIRERRTEHAALIAGARVEVTSGPDAGRSTVSDSGGQYRLERVSTGTFTMRVTAAGFVPETVTVSMCGDRRLEIRLTPANARLEGLVFDTTSGSVPLEGAIVEIVSAPLAGRTAVTDASGAYAFTGVYGRMTVRATKAGFTQEQREINVTDPIVFWNFGIRRQ